MIIKNRLCLSFSLLLLFFCFLFIFSMLIWFAIEDSMTMDCNKVLLTPTILNIQLTFKCGKHIEKLCLETNSDCGCSHIFIV